MLTTVQAGAYLHHLKLLSPDPAALAAFYGEAMDMAVRREDDGSYLCTGPARRLLIGEGPAKALGFGAFAVRDEASLAAMRARAEQEGIGAEPFEGSLFKPGAFVVADPDGNRIVFGLGVEQAPTPGIRGPIQHLTLATSDVQAIEDFYAGKLGFGVSDRVVNDAGRTTTCFMRSNHEHHSLACFYHGKPELAGQGIDHHSYEAGEWVTIRDWCDHLASKNIQLMWGPGRHGPGNNLFIFITDPDGNWIEISAELEVVHDRPVKTWPHGERTLNLWGAAIMRS